MAAVPRTDPRRHAGGGFLRLHRESQTMAEIDNCRIHVRVEPFETWRVYIPKSERDYHDLETGTTYSFAINGHSWKGAINQDGRVTIPKRVRDSDGFDYNHLQPVDMTIEK